MVNGCSIVKSGELVMWVHQGNPRCALFAVGNPWRIRIDSGFPQPEHSMEAGTVSRNVYKKVFSLLCEIGVNFM